MKTMTGSLLVVDDDAMNRDVLSRRLERKGYDVTVAEDGKQALELIDKNAFDLVLLNNMMPDISGTEVLQILRESRSPEELPVVMVAAQIQSEDIVKALNAGANDYLTKPIDFPVALARIRTQLAHKRAEEALRESEERYALAAQAANDGLWDWNLKSNEIYFSPRWKSMLGYEDNEIGNSSDEWLSRIHPDDVGRVRTDLAAHREGVTSHFEKEYRISHSDGSYRWMLSRGLAVRDREGRASRMAGSQTDITEGKVADALTGLPNRILFTDRLERLIQRAKRHKQYLFALLFLDLDRFKVVNDSLGHAAGDEFLREISNRLKAGLRSGDTFARLDGEHTVARLGGDEFAILLDDIKHVSDATCVADRIQKELALPLFIGGHEVFTSASIGIALSATGYNLPEEILRDADTAMYRAKALGKARSEVFDTTMRARALARLDLETDLRRGVERREFRIHYQPILTLATGRLAGFEALVRWQHPKRGLVPPAEFIPMAEETGQIIHIGRFVLSEACRQMREWHSQYFSNPPLAISVNLSGKQFMQPDLIEQIDQILREIGLSSVSLNLEITESVLMENAESTTAVLLQLRARNIALSIDDFGTGYSSFSYLHRFPVNTLTQVRHETDNFRLFEAPSRRKYNRLNEHFPKQRCSVDLPS